MWVRCWSLSFKSCKKEQFDHLVGRAKKSNVFEARCARRILAGLHNGNQVDLGETVGNLASAHQSGNNASVDLDQARRHAAEELGWKAISSRSFARPKLV
eukprot:855538-Amphidinium_carterae.1